MADGDTVGDLSGAGFGTDIQGYGMPGQMMGGGGYGMMGGALGLGFQDPAWTGAMARQKYALALMQQGAQTSPILSPWQALARGVQGALGGYTLRSSIGQMQDQARQWQQDIGPTLQRAHQTVADLLSGQGAAAAPGQTAAGGGAQSYSLAYKGGAEQPATAADIAALPDVKALPVALQPQLSQRLAANGMGINAAAQFARQMKIESGGSNIDPKTGDVIVNKDSGATGLAQIMPATFADLQKKYPDLTGDIRDPATNLEAGIKYFKEGMTGGKGNLAAAAAYYHGGGAGLQAFMSGGAMGPRTAAYLVSTGAMVPAAATPGAAATGGAADGGAAPGGPAPGSGWRAALQMKMDALDLMSSQPNNPFAQRLGQNMLATAPQLAQVGALEPPVPVGQTGIYTQRDPITGKVTTGGQQFDPTSARGEDLTRMQVIGAQAQAAGGLDKLPLPLQQDYIMRWGRQAEGSYQNDPALNRMTWYPPLGVPAGLPVPPGFKAPAGAAAGAEPTPMGQAGSAIRQTEDDSKAAMDQAAKGQLAAYSDESRETLGSNQTIRGQIQRTTPGRLSDISQDFGTWAQSLGVPADLVQKITGQDPTAAQLGAKQLFTLLSNRIKDQGNIRATALWNQFEKALPSMQSTPQTIDAITRLYDTTIDMNRQYADDRFNFIAGMRQKFRLSQNPQDWDERALAGFDRGWASEPGHDPRLWNAAALLMAHVPKWQSGLSDEQIPLAKQLAAKIYPSELQIAPKQAQGQ
jgi:hypothetical protein